MCHPEQRKESSRIFFEFIWRLAILLLPWQTRWFSGAMLAGWPWEQGTVSVYGSWAVMIVLIVVYLLCRPERSVSVVEGPLIEKRFLGSANASLGMTSTLTLLFLAITVLPSLSHPSTLRPVLQWWIQISLLAGFVVSLISAKIDRQKIATWFCIGLIPHALLGLWQFVTQQVIATKWLGIAAQLPATLGVSVIEANGERILRAYGGFPHPNIFGGWLVIGVLLAIWLVRQTVSRRQFIFWSAMSVLFSAALFFTFARSAWIALGVSLLHFFIVSFRRHVQTEEKSPVRTGRCLLPRLSREAGSFDMTRRGIFLIPIFIFFILGFFYSPLLFTRLHPTTRLETKSVATRMQSLRDGVSLFRLHPFFGSGPNVELLSLATSRGYNATHPSPSPLEPPHNVFLLMLDDIGLVGSFLFLSLFVFFRHSRDLRRAQVVSLPNESGNDKRRFIFLPLFISLFILALLDHYLWSTWSGQSLLVLTVLMSIGKLTPEIV